MLISGAAAALLSVVVSPVPLLHGELVVEDVRSPVH